MRKIKQNRDLSDLIHKKMSLRIAYTLDFIIFFSRTTSFVCSYKNDNEKFYKVNDMYYFHDISIDNIIELNEK
jgi:hypothetical protein